jgi:hypothetical protein
LVEVCLSANFYTSLGFTPQTGDSRYSLDTINLSFVG